MNKKITTEHILTKEKELEQKVVISSLPQVVLSELLEQDQIKYLKKEKISLNMAPEHLLRLYSLRSHGFTAKEITEHTGLPIFVVTAVLSSLEYKAMVQTITQDIKESAKMALVNASEKATTCLVSLLDSDDERVKLKASTEILNRVGVDAVKKVEISTKKEHIHQMPQEQLDYILKSAQIANQLAENAKAISVDFVDAEFTEAEGEDSSENE